MKKILTILFVTPMESSSSLQNTSKESPAVSPETLAKYKEIISSLPKDNGWNISVPLCQYQGFWHPLDLLEAAMFAQENFTQFDDNKDDVILLCSVPKTGTTWLKTLVVAIVTRTRFNDSTNNPLLTKFSHECIPFLETSFLDNPKNIINDELGFPIWSTHIPYSSFSDYMRSSSCKIVYVCRDPKDTFVSLWHFLAKITHKAGIDNFVSLEDAFELYCKGISPYGPHWDHVLEFWKASLELPETVLFLKYEEMMIDPVFYTKKLAKFIGFPFSVEEEKRCEVERIVKLCSFENLSNLEVNKIGEYHHKGTCADNNSYFRKGVVGDWKNVLTLEMSKRLDAIIDEKLSGSGFKF